MPELPDVGLYLAASRPRVIGRAIERVRVASPFFVRTCARRAGTARALILYA